MRKITTKIEPPYWNAECITCDVSIDCKKQDTLFTQFVEDHEKLDHDIEIGRVEKWMATNKTHF